MERYQDKYVQKQHLSAAGVAVAPYKDVDSQTTGELQSIKNHFGFPYMLKAKTQAYDGRGNFKIRSANDCDAALKFLHGRPLYAEKYAHFVKVGTSLPSTQLRYFHLTSICALETVNTLYL